MIEQKRHEKGEKAMKRKNNKTQNTVLLQIETQANARLIAKTSKSMLAIFARYFGLGAGFCLLIWSFIEKPVFLTGVEIGIVLLLGQLSDSMGYGNQSEKTVGETTK